MRRARPAQILEAMKAFAALYRKLNSGDLDPRQAGGDGRVLRRRQGRSRAMGERGLDGLFPERRQAAPDRAVPPSLAPRGRGLGLSRLALRRDAMARSAILAEMLSLLLPEGMGGEEVSLDVWMRERLLPLPSLPEEERYARLKQWVGELATDERLAFFKLITGELRVGVSRLQVVKALAEVAGVDEGRMAQRLIGYSQARRIPTAADFEALIGEVLHAEAQALDAGKPYPFYLAQSWSRPLAEMLPTLGPPSDWIIEWKYDGIRAQLLKRGENWRLWSRGDYSPRCSRTSMARLPLRFQLAGFQGMLRSLAPQPQEAAVWNTRRNNWGRNVEIDARKHRVTSKSKGAVDSATDTLAYLGLA